MQPEQDCKGQVTKKIVGNAVKSPLNAALSTTALKTNRDSGVKEPVCLGWLFVLIAIQAHMLAAVHRDRLAGNAFRAREK
jgi:hypothetical protein